MQMEMNTNDISIRWKWKSNTNDISIRILISGKTDLKAKTVTRDKEGHYIMILGVNQTRGYNTSRYLCTQHRSI